MNSATAVFRVVLYGRVSAEREQLSKSVDDQLAELRRWADHEGWQVVATHRDDGVSASRFAKGKTRRGWQNVVDAITEGACDAVLVWEVSRASRDRPAFAALFAACVDADVKIGTGGRLHDLTDGDDAFSLDLGAALAVRESSVISKRTRRAVESRAAAGRPNGSVPFGFRRRIDPDTGRTVGRDKHPDQAPIVAEIVRRLLAGEPANAIAVDLNRRGIPLGTGDRWLGRHVRAAPAAKPEHPVSVEIAARLAAGELPRAVAADLNTRGVEKVVPSTWRSGNLAKLALRPSYAGLRTHHGRVLDGVRATWPAIISEDQHHQLVALFSAPDRARFRRSTHVRHLGGGLFRCGRQECGGRMRVVVAAGKPNRYDCRQCHRTSRLQAPVDELVETVLARRLARPDVLELLAAAAGDDPAAREAAAETTRLRTKLAAYRAALDDDRISLESFIDLESRTLPKIRAADERARPRSLPAEVFEVAGPDAERRWRAAPVNSRRAILSALLTVTILPAGRGSWRFDPELIQMTWRGPVS